MGGPQPRGGSETGPDPDAAAKKSGEKAAYNGSPEDGNSSIAGRWRFLSLLREEKEALAGLGNWGLICCFEFAGAWPEPGDEQLSWAGAMVVFLVAAALLITQGLRPASPARDSLRLQKNPWALAAHATLVIGCVAWLILHVAVGGRSPQVCAGTATLWSLLSLFLVRGFARPSLQPARPETAVAAGLSSAEEGSAPKTDGRQAMPSQRSNPSLVPTGAVRPEPSAEAVESLQAAVSAALHGADPSAKQAPAKAYGGSRVPQAAQALQVLQASPRQVSGGRWIPVFASPSLSDPYAATQTQQGVDPQMLGAQPIVRPEAVHAVPPSALPDPAQPIVRRNGSMEKRELFADVRQIQVPKSHPAEDECAVKLTGKKGAWTNDKSGGSSPAPGSRQQSSEQQEAADAKSMLLQVQEDVEEPQESEYGDIWDQDADIGLDTVVEASLSREQSFVGALSRDASFVGDNSRLSIPTLSIVQEGSNELQPLQPQFEGQSNLPLPVSRPGSQNSGVSKPEEQSSDGIASPEAPLSPGGILSPPIPVSRPCSQNSVADTSDDPPAEQPLESQPEKHSAPDAAAAVEIQKLTQHLRSEKRESIENRTSSKSAPPELVDEEKKPPPDTEEAERIDPEKLRRAILTNIHRRAMKIGDVIGGGRIEELHEVLHRQGDDAWLQEIVKNNPFAALMPDKTYDSDSDDGEIPNGMTLDSCMGNDDFQKIREQMQAGSSAKNMGNLPMLLSSVMGSTRISRRPSLMPQTAGALGNSNSNSRNQSRTNSRKPSVSVPATRGGSALNSARNSRSNSFCFPAGVPLSQQGSRAGSNAGSRRVSRVGDEAEPSNVLSRSEGKRNTLGAATTSLLPPGAAPAVPQRVLQFAHRDSTATVSADPLDAANNDSQSRFNAKRNSLPIPAKRHSMPNANLFSKKKSLGDIPDSLSPMPRSPADSNAGSVVGSRPETPDDAKNRDDAGKIGDGEDRRIEDGSCEDQSASSALGTYCLPCDLASLVGGSEINTTTKNVTDSSQRTEQGTTTESTRTHGRPDVTVDTAKASAVNAEVADDDSSPRSPSSPSARGKRYSLTRTGTAGTALLSRSATLPLEEIAEKMEESDQVARETQAEADEALRAALTNHPSEMRVQDLLARGSVGDLTQLSIGDLLRAITGMGGKAGSSGRETSKESSTYGSDGDASDITESDEEDDEGEFSEDDEEEPEADNWSEEAVRALGSELNMDQAAISEALKLLMMMNHGFKAHHCTCKEGGPHTCMSPAGSQLASLVHSTLQSLSHSLANSKAGSKIQTRRNSTEKDKPKDRRSSTDNRRGSADNRRGSADNTERRGSADHRRGSKPTSGKMSRRGSQEPLPEDDTARASDELDRKGKRDSTRHSSRHSVDSSAGKRGSLDPGKRHSSRKRSGPPKGLEDLALNSSPTSPGHSASHSPAPGTGSPDQASPSNSAGADEEAGSTKQTSGSTKPQRSSLLGSRGSKLASSHVIFDGADAGAGPSADAGAGPSQPKEPLDVPDAAGSSR